jgi:hypothetical protein
VFHGMEITVKMLTKRCNGCRVDLDDDEFGIGRKVRAVIEGRRVDGLSGGSPLPSTGEGDFHWCERCAKIAFRAVEDAALARGR